MTSLPENGVRTKQFREIAQGVIGKNKRTALMKLREEHSRGWRGWVAAKGDSDDGGFQFTRDLGAAWSDGLGLISFSGQPWELLGVVGLFDYVRC